MDDLTVPREYWLEAMAAVARSCRAYEDFAASMRRVTLIVGAYKQACGEDDNG